MRALVQRVSEGAVVIESEDYKETIANGLVVLLGVREGDTEDDMIFVADKCCNLRIFQDENDKMNRSIIDVEGEMLVISQFTLYGDARKGNRPSFTNAASPELAEDLYSKFVDRAKQNLGGDKVKSGIFAAMMQIKIINEGPVTVLVESKDG